MFRAVLLHSVARRTFWANISRMGMLSILVVHVLEAVFVAGAAGACLVTILTGIEDLEIPFGRHTVHIDKE